METTINLEDKLLAEAEHFAKRSRQSLSEVVAEALHEKFSKAGVEVESSPGVFTSIAGLHPDIQRLAGLAPAGLDAKKIYQEHLARRHK